MKNRGIILKHQNGQTGVAYWHEQKRDEGRYLVHVVTQDMKLTGQKSAWTKEKVTLMGYID